MIYAKGKNPVYLQAAGAGYAAVRTASFALTKDTFSDVSTLRGVMLDDDIWLDDAEALKAAMDTADEHGWNIVIPYMLADRSFSILSPVEDGLVHKMTEAEVADLDEYQPIWAAGLGFYYGDIPLDYRFHEGSPYVGEDVNFFVENPELQVRVAPLRAMHKKEFLV